MSQSCDTCNKRFGDWFGYKTGVRIQCRSCYEDGLRRESRSLTACSHKWEKRVGVDAMEGGMSGYQANAYRVLEDG